jgi:GntR family transcriptional repressor for pyruvate dehydrogenase complex
MDKINYQVNKANLYEQVADTLEQAIVRSDDRVKKLPSEQELCGRFNVSRTVIREALKVLKERGLVQPRNGDGSYISRPKPDTVSSAVNRLVQMDNISNEDLHGIRVILETAAVRLAAIHAKPEDFEHLEYALKQMEVRPLTAEKRIQADSDFHITIARASGNKLLELFVEVMTMLLREYMIKGFPGPASIKPVINYHKKILQAVKNRNPDDAEEAMRSHLASARENVEVYEKKKHKGNYGG